MEKGKYILSAFLTLVVLTSSIYFVLNDEVRIDIKTTYSDFSVYENGSWVLAGREYVNVFDGTAKMRAKNRSIDTLIGENNFTTVTRIANYKDGISTIEIYTFDPSIEDVKFFPINHEINVLNGEGKLLQYEVQKLLYTGETIKGVKSPQSFGHRMKVEWQDGNYYSKIYKYFYRDEGKLTVKYKIDSNNFTKNVRLFDPVVGGDLIIESAETYVLGGNNDTFDLVWVKSGGTLQINSTIGWLNLSANNITIEGIINGDGLSNCTGGTSGSRGGANPGTDGGSGGTGTCSGGGGGGGGDSSTDNGVSGGSGGAGATQVGDETSRTDLSQGKGAGGGGGGGGAGCDGCYGGTGGVGSAGGASVRLSSNNIFISGTIVMDGGNGGNGGNGAQTPYSFITAGGGGGGGGSAGTILIDGRNVNISKAKLNVSHGTGGLGGPGWKGGDNGDAGSSSKGGRIKIFYQSIDDFDNSSLQTLLGTSGTIYYLNLPYSKSRVNSTSVFNLTSHTIMGYCNGTGSDNLTYYYNWYKDDVLNSSKVTDINYISGTEINVDNISSSLLLHNETWKLGCITWDGGNYNSTESTSTIKVHQPVWINITYPEQDDIFSDTSHNITYSFENYTNYESCWYTNSSGSENISITCGDVIGPINWNEGNTNVTIYSNISNGEEYLDSVTFSVIINPPKVVYGLDTETNNTWLNHPNITVDLVIQDDRAFSNSSYFLYNETGELVNTTTFTTLQTAFGNVVWNTTSHSGDGNYSFNTTTYNIFSQSNSTNTRFVYVDSVYPLIEYTPNSDTINESGNFTVKDWIFVNVTASDLNEKNITFNLLTSLGEYNITSFTDDTRIINWTNLPRESMYYWNVIICDMANNCNTTDTRYYGDEVVNFSIDSFFSNQAVELGTELNITATSTYDWVWVDIDHPSYGDNYSSSKWTTSFNITIDWFRKTIFNSGTTSNKINYTGRENFDLDFEGHQYDEILNMSFNISGENNPTNIQINKSNTTEIDRYYDGVLTGPNIYLNHDGDNITETNLTYTSGSQKNLYFNIDDNQSNMNILMNLTGLEYGLSYSEDYLDSFSNWADIDIEQTTAYMSKGGFFLFSNGTKQYSYYDSYDSSINSTLWGEFVSNALTGTNSETNDYIQSNLAYGQGAAFSNHVAYVYPNNQNYLNLWSTDKMIFRVVSDYDGGEGGPPTVWGYSRIYINSYDSDGRIWTSSHLDDARNNGHESGDADLIFTAVAFNNTHWQVDISGVETSSVGHYYGCVSGANTFTATGIWNWTSGISTITCNQPSYGGPFIGSLDNSFYTPVIFNTTVLLVSESIASKDTDAELDNMITRLYPINKSVFYESNKTIISNSIYDASGDISDATMGGGGHSESNSNIIFYLSADDGVNWENVASGVQHTFTNAGRNLKWRMDLEIPTDGYHIAANRLDSVNVTTPKGYPDGIYIDFGDDGITDYSFTDELNSTNSPITINISNPDITGSSHISGYTHLLKVPMKITSYTPGQINIDTINITYNPNPIKLSITSIISYLSGILGMSTFPINLMSTGGNITVDDIKLDYVGGNKTYTITAHNNDSSVTLDRNVTYYSSYWDYSWVPKDVDYIYFGPRKPTSTNVTPWGQNAFVPILNITNYGYGNKNTTLSVYMNSTLACVNTTLSFTENKTDGFIINDSWLNITDMEYLETIDIWLWSDYNCNYTTWNLFNPYLSFRQCCDGCICSEEVV